MLTTTKPAAPQVRSANVTRTTICTLAAAFWLAALGNGWIPVVDLPIPEDIAVILSFVLIGVPPLINLSLGVRDARALERGKMADIRNVFRWLMTLLCVVVNFVLIGLTLLFGAMLLSGPVIR
jgi:hypothetical protein